MKPCSQKFYKWNEEMARKYNPDSYHKKSFFIIRLIEKLRVRTIVKLLDAARDDMILEIGCGAGNIMEAFRHGRIFGIDLSPFLLTIAKTRRYRIPPYLIQSYGEIMPFQPETFDKIYCSEVLEHVQDPKAICREAHRVLKKRNSIFVFSVPNEQFINSIKRLLRFLFIDRLINFLSGYKFSKDMTDEWHLHNFDLDYAKGIVGDFFIVEKIKYIPCAAFPVRIVFSCRKRI